MRFPSSPRSFVVTRILVMLQQILCQIEILIPTVQNNSLWTAMATDDTLVDELCDILGVGSFDRTPFDSSTQIILCEDDKSKSILFCSPRQITSTPTFAHTAMLHIGCKCSSCRIRDRR